MSRIRGALNAGNYPTSRMVSSLEEAMQVFGSESAMRDEFTRFRDMWYKRLDRAIKGGVDLTGTAMERFVTGTPGNYKMALPTIKQLRTPGKIARGLGAMQRAAARPTSSKRGIKTATKEMSEQFSNFLEEWGLEDSNVDQKDVIGYTLDVARALGISGLTYKDILARLNQRGVQESIGDAKDMTRPQTVQKARELLAEILVQKRAEVTKEEVGEKGNRVTKGAYTRAINELLREKYSPKSMDSAIKRLNNALRKYGGD